MFTNFTCEHWTLSCLLHQLLVDQSQAKKIWKKIEKFSIGCVTYYHVSVSSEGIHGVYIFLNSYFSICIEGKAHMRDLVNGGDISPMIDGVSNIFYFLL